ncbi:serine/threonine protein kinase [Planctomicrobium sp. SH668]|uniref:serine/threonine protein kinase n=1 Tax=Planctomicrobium sp. SH668 TaxID=3448126 RepID=UPI003F5C2F00
MQTQPPKPESRWIWPFEILEQIGEGGMGVVFRARYVVNDRMVALKMLPGDITDKTALARFEREVEVLKTLKHPNIVRCFGGVCEDKRRFYAMELLEGGSLEDRLVACGRFPWEQTIEFGLQMCAALAYSHEKGVVHRDVKPSNFLLGPNGELKLSDFGLASVAAARKITAAGKTAGTFLYMAPEQIRGLEVTPRTDLYALGCVLYELVTGRVPFIGETPGATLHLHSTAVPKRPTELALDCPPGLEAIILKLLEKPPEMRFQSASEVAEKLKSISNTIVVKPKPGIGGIVAAAEDSLHQNQTEPRIAPTQFFPTDKPPHSPKLFQLTLISLGLLGASLLLNLYQSSRVSRLSQAQKLWVEAYQTGSPDVRTHAARSLGKLASSDASNLSILKEDLTNADASRRVQVIDGLAEAGRGARNVVPQLTKIQISDENEAARVAAANAIHRIANPTSAASFPWLRTGFMLLSFGALIYLTLSVLKLREH